MLLLFVVIITIVRVYAFTRGALLSFRRRGIYLFLLRPRTHLGAINFPENKLLFLRGIFIFYSFPFLYIF